MVFPFRMDSVFLNEIMAYSIRILWIATAWLATGLFMALLFLAMNQNFNERLVNFLFVCLLIIVVGSMVGQWMAVYQKFDNQTNFGLDIKAMNILI